MEWTITIREKEQYVEIITKGVEDGKGSLDMAKAIAITMSKNQIKRVLIDQRNVDSVSGGTIDIYQRPKQLKATGVINELKIAEIVNPEHNEFFNFLETVCINSGLEFATFNDKKSALEWIFKQ